MCAKRHSEKYEIYCIIGVDSTPVYVGQAKDAYKRFKSHCKDYGNPALACWIQDMKSAGTPAELRILEIVEGKDAAIAAEKQWIEHYTHNRFLRLFNRSNNTQRFTKGAPSFCYYIVVPIECGLLNRLVNYAKHSNRRLSELIQHGAETYGMTLHPSHLERPLIGKRSKIK